MKTPITAQKSLNLKKNEENEQSICSSHFSITNPAYVFSLLMDFDPNGDQFG